MHAITMHPDGLELTLLDQTIPAQWPVSTRHDAVQLRKLDRELSEYLDTMTAGMGRTERRRALDR